MRRNVSIPGAWQTREGSRVTKRRTDIANGLKSSLYFITRLSSFHAYLVWQYSSTHRICSCILQCYSRMSSQACAAIDPCNCRSTSRQLANGRMMHLTAWLQKAPRLLESAHI